MAYFPTVTCMLQIARIVLQIHRSQLPFRFYYYYVHYGHNILHIPKIWRPTHTETGVAVAPMRCTHQKLKKTQLQTFTKTNRGTHSSKNACDFNCTTWVDCGLRIFFQKVRGPAPHTKKLYPRISQTLTRSQRLQLNWLTTVSSNSTSMPAISALASTSMRSDWEFSRWGHRKTAGQAAEISL